MGKEEFVNTYVGLRYYPKSLLRMRTSDNEKLILSIFTNSIISDENGTMNNTYCELINETQTLDSLVKELESSIEFHDYGESGNESSEEDEPRRKKSRTEGTMIEFPFIYTGTDDTKCFLSGLTRYGYSRDCDTNSGWKKLDIPKFITKINVLRKVFDDMGFSDYTIVCVTTINSFI